jgi:hypothetical protein
MRGGALKDGFTAGRRWRANYIAKDNMKENNEIVFSARQFPYRISSAYLDLQSADSIEISPIYNLPDTGTRTSKWRP